MFFGWLISIVRTVGKTVCMGLLDIEKEFGYFQIWLFLEKLLRFFGLQILLAFLFLPRKTVQILHSISSLNQLKQGQVRGNAGKLSLQHFSASVSAKARLKRPLNQRLKAMLLISPCVGQRKMSGIDKIFVNYPFNNLGRV